MEGRSITGRSIAGRSIAGGWNRDCDYDRASYSNGRRRRTGGVVDKQAIPVRWLN
jgi:hypothetical protein